MFVCRSLPIVRSPHSRCFIIIIHFPPNPHYSHASQQKRELSSVLYILHKEIAKTFPNSHASSSGIIGSFFMLRFVCPALISPARQGFIDGTFIHSIYLILSFMLVIFHI